jgi:hypothetical protein
MAHVRVAFEHRVAISLALAAVAGAIGPRLYPFNPENAVLSLVAVYHPTLFSVLAYGYAAAWCSTSFLVFNVATTTVYVLAARVTTDPAAQALPTYPPVPLRRTPFLVLGELHHQAQHGRAAAPAWLTVPERGLYTGIAIVGAIGSGKTSACMYPYVQQLLGYRAREPARRIGGLILEVKGDFCQQVRGILNDCGRSADYVEVSLTSSYRYNPLHNDLDAYALAFGIATLMTNLFGRGKEPFWQQASTNLVKFVILLHQVLDDYVTLFQVYEHVINPDKLRARITAGEARFGGHNRRVLVDKAQHLENDVLNAWTWHDDETGKTTWTHWSVDLEQTLKANQIPWHLQQLTPDAREVEKAAQFEAVKRWFEDDWTRIEAKLRTSIVEGVSVFLSLFDDNPAVKHTFCPPKDAYDAVLNQDGRLGVPLPPLANLIEQGKVVALNFPAAMNPALARALGTMLKQDFQRAVLNRIPSTSTQPEHALRPVLFVCDEYQAFATTGENEPSGDEKFFSLARQARCIPIVATQSISSLRTVLPGESWRTLLQGLRTKIFLTLSDDFSAQVAADLCGKAERLKPGYTLTEAGQDARVSLLTGRPTAHRATVSATKTYSLALEYVFQPKAFAELQNAQAIVLAYDGANPLPPTYCYLKPHYLDVQTSYFDHLAAGVL